jgi:hypothetical protein
MARHHTAHTRRSRAQALTVPLPGVRAHTATAHWCSLLEIWSQIIYYSKSRNPKSESQSPPPGTATYICTYVEEGRGEPKKKPATSRLVGIRWSCCVMLVLHHALNSFCSEPTCVPCSRGTILTVCSTDCVQGCVHGLIRERCVITEKYVVGDLARRPPQPRRTLATRTLQSSAWPLAQLQTDTLHQATAC